MNHDSDPELALLGGAALSRQIQCQIREHIATGQLQAGEELPTVRALAVDLSVNPAVVTRAYQELERDGFLTSEEGSGTFVAPLVPVEASPAEVQADLEKLCWGFLTQAARLGFCSVEVIEMLQALAQRRVSS
jgi:GntR family transcriptional regulator